MSEEKTIQKKLLIQKAKSYESMTWLGLLIFPLAIIFCMRAYGTAKEASVYKLTDEEKAELKRTTSSARNIAITLTVLWVISLIIIFIVQVNAMNQMTRATRSFTRYGY